MLWELSAPLVAAPTSATTDTARIETSIATRDRLPPDGGDDAASPKLRSNRTELRPRTAQIVSTTAPKPTNVHVSSPTVVPGVNRIDAATSTTPQAPTMPSTTPIAHRAAGSVIDTASRVGSGNPRRRATRSSERRRSALRISADVSTHIASSAS